MAIADEIAAIEADETKTPEEKRRARFRLKAERFAQLLDNVEERTFTRGLWSVTVSEPALVQMGGEWVLKMHIRALRNGNLRFNDDLVVVNPPVLVRDAQGALQENIRLALRDIIVGVLR